MNKVHNQIERDIERMKIYYNDTRLQKNNYFNFVKDYCTLDLMHQGAFAPIYFYFVDIYQKNNTYVVDGGYEKYIYIYTKKNKTIIYITSHFDIVIINNGTKQHIKTIKFYNKQKIRNNNVYFNFLYYKK
jgi:hypothetical protein